MSEAKGSDVRSLRDDLSKLFDGICFLESGYQHQRGMASDETTRLLNAIMPLVKARVQAAAVEMRERCAELAHVEPILAPAGCIPPAGMVPLSAGGLSETITVEIGGPTLEDRIRALPIPADALDAMLLRARIEGAEEAIRTDENDLCYGHRYIRKQKRKLAALTRSAAERKEKL